MTTIELHTLSGAYVLHALTPEEAERFEEHLAACAACQTEVGELQAAAAELGASEAVSPPPHLKARILAAADRLAQLPPRVSSTGPEPSPASKWGPRLLAAAAVVTVAIAAGIVGYDQIQGSSDDQMAAPVSQVFEAPDARTTTVETSNGGEVAVATSGSLNRMAVDTDELPPLSEEQVYQLWTLRDGTAHSAGLLEDVDDGAAMDMPAEGSDVAITIEPAGGSEQPSTSPVVVVTPGEV